LDNELAHALKVTVVGMTIVFVSLYVLQLVMAAMRVLFYRGERQAVADVETHPTTQHADHKSRITDHKVMDAATHGESHSVLAAISAAIHVCLGGKRHNIVAIRRDQPSAWQQVARATATTRNKD